jgi:hypothetical protein
MLKCYNGHRKEHIGCAGCHHAFHVVRPGKISEGRLVMPVVNGPMECPLCHGVLHHTPVSGCPQCEGRFEEVLREAMIAAKPVRMEIMQLQFLRWFVSWQARLAGWFGLLAGKGIADWFERSDGSTNWLSLLLASASIPLIQWAIRKRIAKRERLLPQLSPKGEIVYDSDLVDH